MSDTKQARLSERLKYIMGRASVGGPFTDLDRHFFAEAISQAEALERPHATAPTKGKRVVLSEATIKDILSIFDKRVVGDPEVTLRKKYGSPIPERR